MKRLSIRLLVGLCAFPLIQRPLCHAQSTPDTPSEEVIPTRPSTQPAIELPPLDAYQLVGWADDKKGKIVILRNQGARFVYYAGRVHYGSHTSTSIVPEMNASIQGDELVLSQRNRTVRIRLKPKSQS